MKQAQVNIPLKAVVTPSNKNWVFGDLLAHLSEEHASFTAAAKGAGMSIKRFVSALLTGALCLGVLTACGSTQKPASSGVSADAQRYSTIFYDAFDTVTQVIAYCDSEEEFTRQMDAHPRRLAGIPPPLRHLQRLRRRW